MQLTLELDDELSPLCGNLGLLPDLQLPGFPGLLMYDLALLSLLHHHLQFFTESNPRLAGLPGRGREALHDAVDLLRYLEDALLDLCNFGDNLLVVVCELAELLCILGLYRLDGFFLLLGHVAIVRVLVAADLVLLCWH